MIRYISIAVAILIALSLVVRCEKLGFHHWAWQQKLTVVVDTPYGPRSGSSVIAVTLKIDPKWAGLGDSAGSAKWTFKGEAVAVEVVPSKYLFALIRGNDGQGYDGSTAIEVLLSKRKPGAVDKGEYFARLDAFEKSRQTISLPPDKYPLLVSFRDPSTPLSVISAGPSDFSDVFGPGYSLRSVTLSFVDEEVTEGIVDPILPWLNEYKGRTLDGKTIVTREAANQLANSLSPYNFRTQR
jgi:hypothetical protein